MAAMPSSPHVSAALVSVAAASLAVHLATGPSPFAPSSATVVAIGAMLFAIITAVGLVLVRGRWARYLGLVVAGGSVVVAATADDLGPWEIAAIVAGLAAVGTLAGRWLDVWIRARPSATGPDPKAVLLLLGLLGLVPVAGLVCPSGLDTAHGALGAAGVLLAWGYGKAQVWALWAARLVLPVVVVLAALAAPWPGAVAIVAYGAGLTWLAWQAEVRLAVQPLMDQLPGPRSIRGPNREAPL
jgi:hypothetical protein